MRLILSAIFALLIAAPLHAQTYPNQPVRVIVSFGPGAATDVFARMFAESLQAELGQPVVVENKPGANGTIAAEFVARSKPDGYTLILATGTSHASNAWLMKEIRYNPVTDFTPITRLGVLGLTIAVAGDSPYKSLGDLVNDAKRQPGKLTFGSGNSSGIVTYHSLSKTFDTDMILVEYRSTPQALTDVIAGRVTAMLSDFTSAGGQMKAGALRPLAVTSGKRSPLYPDVPTMDEAGVKGFELVAWMGLFGPAGMPVNVVSTLNAKSATAVTRAELQPRFAALGIHGFSSTPQELADYQRIEINNWERYVKTFGIKQE